MAERSIGTAERTRYRHGLTYLATLAFVGGFFGARLFHTALPSLMIITPEGVHFHHFWYGLAMMVGAGWLGIAYNDERLNRIYAVVFGVGAGFLGDEVGLLLTFGDYYTSLTFDFFVAAIASIVLLVLVTRYGKQVEDEIFRLNRREKIAHVGIFVLGFSTLFLAFGVWILGAATAVVGVILVLSAYVRERRSHRPGPS